MTNAPGTNEAAYLSFMLTDELIRLLVDKGVIAEADVSALLTSLLKGVEQDGRTLAQSSAQVVRDMIAKREIK